MAALLQPGRSPAYDTLLRSVESIQHEVVGICKSLDDLKNRLGAEYSRNTSYWANIRGHGIRDGN